MHLSQKSLQYKVLKNIEENKLIFPGEKIIVAVSGGADSVCLFDVLYKLKEKLKIEISVCHYNHRLRGKDSYNDFEFVQKMASDRGVEFIGGEAKSDNLFKNEDEAREARYAFFGKILKEGRGDKVAIAHNLNDLAETFIFRLLRGSGMRGLKSIPLSRKNFIRPLLSVPRSEIETYLKNDNIKYCTDKTNTDTVYTRNFIRAQVMPLLHQINPNLAETLSGNTAALEEDYNLLDQLTEESYKAILIEEKKDSITLSRKDWLLLHPSLQASVIRYAISKIASLDDVTYKQIYEARKMIQKGEGKKYKPLPHSLRIQLESGKIEISISGTSITDNLHR